MLIGSTAYTVEEDSKWWCDIEKEYVINHRVQSWLVIARDETTDGSFLCFGGWLSAGRHHTTVRSIPGYRLLPSHAAAEGERLRRNKR